MSNHQYKEHTLTTVHKFKNFVNIFLAASAVEGILVLISMMLIPPDPKNALFWGYSTQRLGLMVLVLLLSAFFAFLAWFIQRRPEKSKRVIEQLLSPPALYNALRWCAGILFLLGWVFSFLPPYRTGAFQPYFERLQPVIIWFMLIFGQAFILLFLAKAGLSFREWLQKRRLDRPLWISAAISLAVMLMVWALIALTRIGLNPDSTFWNQAGTPVMGIQLLMSWFTAFLFLKFENRGRAKHAWKIDLAISVAIWLFAVLLWTNTPFKGDFFVTALHDPNFEYYPASDAIRFDQSAQYALIGQLYSNGQNVSRPLFTFFITAVYTLFGNDIDTLITAQIWFFAWIPVILYWIGKQLRNRSAGLLAAIMVIFIESNAIFTSRLAQRTNVHLLMTELPALLLLAAITFLILRWMEKPDQRWTAAAAAGGLLGLSTLVRNNTWALLPAVIVFVFAACWKQRRIRWKFTLWFMLGLLAAVLPWMVRSSIQNRNPFYILIPAKSVVWGNRFTPLLEETFPSEKITSTPAAQKDPNQPQPTAPQPPVNTSQPNAGVMSKAAALFEVVFRHFSHNLVTSGLAFPMQLTLDDSEHLMTTPDSFWNPDWQGKVTPENIGFIFLTLAGIALGISAAWFKRGAAAFFPLWIFLAYNAGTAVARTSGGRYLIPIEWVLPLYLALGLMTLTIWTLDGSNSTANYSRQETALADLRPEQKWVISFAICGAFLAFASFVALADSFYPRKYAIESTAKSLERVSQIPELANLEGIQQFMASPFVVTMEGTALYPMYLKINDFEATLSKHIPQGEKAEITFSMIGPFRSQQVVLPIETIPALPNASRVWVAGCQQERFVDALAVVVYHNGAQTIYLRSPLSSLQCPLP